MQQIAHFWHRSCLKLFIATTVQTLSLESLSCGCDPQPCRISLFTYWVAEPVFCRLDATAVGDVFKLRNSPHLTLRWLSSKSVPLLEVLSKGGEIYRTFGCFYTLKVYLKLSGRYHQWTLFPPSADVRSVTRWNLILKTKCQPDGTGPIGGRRFRCLPQVSSSTVQSRPCHEHKLGAHPPIPSQWRRAREGLSSFPIGCPSYNAPRFLASSGSSLRLTGSGFDELRGRTARGKVSKASVLRPKVSSVSDRWQSNVFCACCFYYFPCWPPVHRAEEGGWGEGAAAVMRLREAAGGGGGTGVA